MTRPTDHGSAVSAVARLAVRQLWKSTAVWASLFFLVTTSSVKGYALAYPHQPQRAALAATIVRNPGFQALYGAAHRLDTEGGFAAWRAGGSLVVLGAVWGLLAATRLLRGEEEAGRVELLRSGAVTSVSQTATSLFLVLMGALVLGAAVTSSTLLLGLAAGGSFALGCEVAVCSALFASVGGVTSQLLRSRRRASGVAAITLGAALMLRVVTDGTKGLGWVRWTTPFGWAEESRPFSGNRSGPLVGLLIIAAGGALLAVLLARHRDLGAGLADSGRAATSHLVLLSLPETFALRSTMGSVAAWALSSTAVAFVVGLLIRGITDFAHTSSGLQTFGDRLGGAKLAQANGFIGLTFGFFAIVIALFAVLTSTRPRQEEVEGRLELVLSGAVGRVRWIAASVLAAASGAVLIAALTGAATWAGARAVGVPTSLPGLLGGGLNCVPAAACFAGLTVAVFGMVPRWTTAAGIGLVVGTYVLQLVGSLARAPGWVLDLSPFHHVAPAPGAAVNGPAAVAMLAIGVLGAAIGAANFARRDLRP